MLVLWVALCALAVSPAHAQSAYNMRLDGFGAAGLLASPGATSSGLAGAFLMSGVRWRIGPYFALSFDIGYGILGSSEQVEDRWWLMPSLALVVPAGDLYFDLGAGLGFGETSGFRTAQDFLDRPFTPDWSFQLVPEIRGHLIAAYRVNPSMDAFVRFDVAGVVLDHNDIGIRDGDPHRDVRDTVWLTLSVGTTFRLL